MKWRDKVNIGLLDTVSFGDTYKIRVYQDRLAIWRTDGQRLSWEEVQEVKQFVWGDTVAIEVYPAQSDVINERHTRYLWSTNALREAVAKECNHKESRNE